MQAGVFEQKVGGLDAYGHGVAPCSLRLAGLGAAPYLLMQWGHYKEYRRRIVLLRLSKTPTKDIGISSISCILVRLDFGQPLDTL